MARVQNELPRPGVEILCDDGVCSQCVKTSEGARPWLLRHGEREPEDFLRDGFVCAEEFLEDSEAERVEVRKLRKTVLRRPML